MSLYGSVLWDFSSDSVNYFFVAWRKSVRHILGLPYKTHSVYLPLMVEDLPVEVQLYNRFMKFFLKIVNSQNKVV